MINIDHEAEIGYNYFNFGGNNSPNSILKNEQLAGVFGISGIAPIGKKASFIFDSMII